MCVCVAFTHNNTTSHSLALGMIVCTFLTPLLAKILPPPICLACAPLSLQFHTCDGTYSCAMELF